jgi:threonine synthase
MQATEPPGRTALGKSERRAIKYDAWFQCADGCEGRYELTEIVYRCPECGGLLQVAHDISALRMRSAAAWMSLFDKRYMRTNFPFGSGVWGKKELVHPTIDDENIVSIHEGGTNLFWAERFGASLGLEDLWIKQSGNSHTGSFKDLGITVLVSAVKEIISSGGDIRAVICASTGDTSASVSAYCAASGIPAVVLLPKSGVSRAQLVQPISNGAITLALDTDFDGCMELVQKLSEDKRFYLANSVNPLRIEGQKTVSIEIVQQFDWEVPDWIIVPGGNLGNVTAIGLGFLLMRDLGLIQKLPRLVCAQAEGANPLYLSYLKGFEEFEPVAAKSTLATAIQIGNPVSVRRAIPILKQFDGIVEQASEYELAHASALADRAGMFTCPQTGVALASLLKLADKGIIQPKDRVIVISTANGLKFVDFKVAYHGEEIPSIESALANKPVELPGTQEAVLDALSSIG